MEVIRNMTIDTELFRLGDIISFALSTGEKVKAKAIRETPNGMLFITVDCLKDEQSMFKTPGRMGGMEISYFNSDLRHTLNGEILDTFPEEIKRRMVGMQVGQTNCFDMLRIPTEREIFGMNHYGVRTTPVSVRRFYGMENRRERIAFQGSETGIEEWYWLQNKVEDSTYRTKLRIPLPISSISSLSAAEVLRTAAPLPILMAFARSFSYPKISLPYGASSIKNGGVCRADKM